MPSPTRANLVDETGAVISTIVPDWMATALNFPVDQNRRATALRIGDWVVNSSGEVETKPIVTPLEEPQHFVRGGYLTLELRMELDVRFRES